MALGEPRPHALTHGFLDELIAARQARRPFDRTRAEFLALGYRDIEHEYRMERLSHRQEE
jgi:hypothetical protein